MNWRELRERAYAHGLIEGDLFHEKCDTCTALKHDIALLRRRDARSIPRPMVEGDIYPAQTVSDEQH